MIDVEIGFLNKNKVRYSFTLYNKYNILCGLSASGKSLLCYMVRSIQSGAFGYYAKGIEKDMVKCLPNNAISINYPAGSIVFIDEEAVLLDLPDVATILQNSDCYFVIINRENLKYLPVNCYDIFTIDEHSKHKVFKPVHKVDCIYSNR